MHTGFQNPFAAAAISSPAAARSARVLRNPPDGWLILASLVHVIACVLYPRFWLFGLGIWWILNTVSHNFIHNPFFHSRRANRCFAFFLTLITFIPHRIWRDRHLAHHADATWKFRKSREFGQQTVFLLVIGLILGASLPQFFIGTLVPGLVLGLVLCWLQGYFEHAHGTGSHYGGLYNWLFFNDGLHIEHHRDPKLHWHNLRRATSETGNTWPAVLRWLDILNLDGLERAASRFGFLRRWLVDVHARSIREVWAGRDAPARVAIIGGGLFPRSALVVHQLWPQAQITVYEADRGHLEEARHWLPGGERLIHSRINSPQEVCADLIILPLAFNGTKSLFYNSEFRGSRRKEAHSDLEPQRSQVSQGLLTSATTQEGLGKGSHRILVHDWLWRRRTNKTRMVSWLLCKRVNLVEP